jgi:hypothetical protein
VRYFHHGRCLRLSEPRYHAQRPRAADQGAYEVRCAPDSGAKSGAGTDRNGNGAVVVRAIDLDAVNADVTRIAETYLVGRSGITT